MNITKIAAVAASAYNVCGPKTGTEATPSTIGKFGKAVVLDCLARYEAEHDGEMFTREDIRAAHAALSA